MKTIYSLALCSVAVLVALVAPLKVAHADEKDDLARTQAETMLANAEKENAAARKRIAEAGGGDAAVANFSAATSGATGTPRADSVFWQGGRATVLVVMPDGSRVFKNPGEVVGERWRVVVNDGKPAIVGLREDHPHGR